MDPLGLENKEDHGGNNNPFMIGAKAIGGATKKWGNTVQDTTEAILSNYNNQLNDDLLDHDKSFEIARGPIIVAPPRPPVRRNVTRPQSNYRIEGQAKSLIDSIQRRRPGYVYQAIKPLGAPTYDEHDIIALQRKYYRVLLEDGESIPSISGLSPVLSTQLQIELREFQDYKANGGLLNFDEWKEKGKPLSPLTQQSVTNSAGSTVNREYVNNQEELLRAAEEAAGGSLDNYNNYKPDWWESPDGNRRIEWNPEGHANTNEGPHVTIRDFNGKRHGVTRKIFIRGRDTYR